MKTIKANTSTGVVNPTPKKPLSTTKVKEKPAVTGFDHLIELFAQQGITLVPSLGKNQKFIYVLIRDGEVRQLSSFSELSLIRWAIGAVHA